MPQGYLLDTHILIWATHDDLLPLLPAEASAIITDAEGDVFFSAASIWEATIKASLGRADFDVDPEKTMLCAIANGYRELPIHATHTVGVGALPPIHKNPFDRLLIAQARACDLKLVTADDAISAYGAGILLVSREEPPTWARFVRPHPPRPGRWPAGLDGVHERTR